MTRRGAVLCGVMQQITVYVDVGTAELLAARARVERRSMSAQAALMIEAALGARVAVPEKTGTPASEMATESVVASRAAKLPVPRPVKALGDEGGADSSGKLFARAGCLGRVPMGARCSECGAIHQP